MKAEWTNNDSLTSGETTKAIFVIDMPKVCGECKASFCGEVWYCYAGEYRRPLFTENIHEKPSWCPLRPLPQKKEIRDAIQYRGLAEEYRKEGWNACIDAITGETE